MNADRLLAHFERISDAPDAVDRLRRFILDLAVRGKLVEQDPGEGTANDFVGLTPSTSQKTKTPAHIPALRLPLPQSWRQRTLGAVSSRIHYGYTASANRQDQRIRMLRITDIQNNSVDWNSVPGCVIEGEDVDNYRLARNDILVARTGGTIGKTFLVEDVPVVAVFASYLIRVQPRSEVNARYVKLFMGSPLYWLQLHEGSRGGGQPNVNGKTLSAMAFPLPPLAEQHRIVEKVDELMMLCDRLEASQAEREGRRDRLVVASLNRLSQPTDPDEFKKDAGFQLLNLSRLSTKPEHIKQIRKAILNLAVRGKLVPQDEEDSSEPLESLIQRRLSNGESRPTRRGVPEIVRPSSDLDDDSLPNAWIQKPIATLLRAGVLLDLKDGNHGANHPVVGDFTEKGMPFITAAQVSEAGQIDYDGAYKIEGKPLSKLKVGFAVPGDVVYTHKGSVGRVAICHCECVLSPQTTYYRPDAAVLASEFLRVVLRSPWFARQADAVKKQTTRDFVPISTQYHFFLRLPPLAEQKRIVAKVDELMLICDQLDTQLESQQKESRRLLEALLHDALEGVE